MMIFVIAMFLAVASVMPFIRHEAWWIRIFDFPRAQILVLGLVVLGLSLMFFDSQTLLAMGSLLATASAVIIQAFSIVPYTPLARKEVLRANGSQAGASLSLLIANVLMGNRRYTELLALIARHQPDIILLLEPDAWWEERMRPLDKGYPHAIKQPLDNEYGMLMYSRLPLLGPEIKYLVRDGIPSMHTRVQLPTGELIWLHGVHPEPPSPTEADSSLPRDAELLIVGREVKGRNTPTIVAGDLNDVAWSYTTRLFQKTSELLDPRKGRGMFNTYNARVPFMRWPLDHVFHSRHFLLSDLQRLPAFGSDHFPVYVRLVLQPDAVLQQRAPTADEEDKRIATQKIQEGEQSPTKRK